MLLCTALVVSDIFNSDIEKKINETLKTINLSDSSLLLDVRTFVRNDGEKIKGTKPLFSNSSSTLAPTAGNKDSLRVYPVYSNNPTDTQLRGKLMDMLRQHLYTTQEKMEALVPILRKYENDHFFRMAFIFNRLRQLVTDIRRVYTLAYTNKKIDNVYTEIYWYAHIVKMYFDILYIVEYVIDYHKTISTEFDIQS